MSEAVTFGLGAALGGLVSWIIGRYRAERKSNLLIRYIEQARRRAAIREGLPRPTHRGGYSPLSDGHRKLGGGS